MRTISAVLLAVVAALGGTALAEADPPGFDKRAGIDKARAHGIIVEASAEQLMADAPAGSCFNDPTQAKCAKVKRMTASDQVTMPNGATGFASVGTRSSSRKARSSQFFNQCWVHSQDPVYSGGWMWGQGGGNCTARVAEWELYVGLGRNMYDGRGWENLDTRWAHKWGGGSLTRQAGYNCGHTRNLHYRTNSQAYARIEATWYGGQNINDAWRTC